MGDLANSSDKLALTLGDNRLLCLLWCTSGVRDMPLQVFDRRRAKLITELCLYIERLVHSCLVTGFMLY